MKTSRHSWVAALVVGALTAAAASSAVRLPLDPGVREFLPEEVPAVAEWLGLLGRFDGFNAWMVGLEEPGSSLSVEGLRHVDGVTRQLEGLKASGVLAVRSVTNVLSLREGDDGAVTSELLVNALPKDPVSLDAMKQRILGDREVLGALVSRDLTGYTIVIRADPRKDAAEVSRLIERTVEASRGPLAARYLGAPFFAGAPIHRLAARALSIGLVFGALVVGILLIGAGRPREVALVLAGAGVSLVWWLGLLAKLGGSLTPSSGPLALGLLAIAGATFGGQLEVVSTGQGGLLRGALSGCFAAGLAVVAVPTRPEPLLTALLPIALIGLAWWVVGVGGRSSVPSSSEPPVAFPPARRVALCLVVIAAGGLLAWRARIRCTPSEMFSPHDEVGESLAFFDGKFGGSDFIQIDYRGDLNDPAVTARLLRLTDLLGGVPAFSDVRSVASILGFLNHGFGDALRIPASREALANIWFFLEGNGDVRNLVSDRHDEAMVVIRVPALGDGEIGPRQAEVQAAIAGSAERGPSATAERLRSIARASHFELEPGRLDGLLRAAAAAPDAAEATAIATEVARRLRVALASPDSPYQPSDDEWERLAAILRAQPPDLRTQLAATAAQMQKLKAAGMDTQFVDLLLEREQALGLGVRSQALAARLWEGEATVPADFRLRAEGVVADLLDPQASAGTAVVTITGLPVVAGSIAANLKAGWWRALWLIIGLGFILGALVRGRGAALGVLVGLTATGLTFIGCWAAGVQMDSGSARLYLLPALVGPLAAGRRRWPRVFLFALGIAALALLLAGSLPVTRLAAAAAMGLCAVAIVSRLLGQGTPWSQRRGLGDPPAAPHPVNARTGTG